MPSEFKIEVTIPEAVINTNSGEDIWDYIRDCISEVLPNPQVMPCEHINVEGHWHITNGKKVTAPEWCELAGTSMDEMAEVQEMVEEGDVRS